MSARARTIAFLAAMLGAGASARAITLADYARQHSLVIQTVRAGEEILWQGICDRTLRGSTIRSIRLEPGDTTWRLETDREAHSPSADEPRKLAFSLRNLEIRIKGRAEPLPKK